MTKGVQGVPKSFVPESRDETAGNAWDSLLDLSRKAAAVNADPETMIALARNSIRARHARGRHLPDPMFGEPGWEMLLSLYVAAPSDARHTVSSLSEASGAPPTTALRWIVYLERAELVERHSSPTDKRVAFLRMTAKGRKAIESYLAELIEGGIVAPGRG